MNCIGLVANDTCKMRFRVLARLAPRCGVERKMTAETALAMESYAGSPRPLTQAYRPADKAGSAAIPVFLDKLPPTSFTIKPPME
jgi:hypothetical protein